MANHSFHIMVERFMALPLISSSTGFSKFAAGLGLVACSAGRNAIEKLLLAVLLFHPGRRGHLNPCQISAGRQRPAP